MGGGDDTLTAFSPVTARGQGRILGAKFSGLAAAELEYTLRPVSSLSLDLDAAYFFRTGGGPDGSGVPGSGYALGPEFYARGIWVPLSDLSFILGGGVFLPSGGNSDPAGEPRWSIGLSLSAAF
jgi:hypothetical protein